MEKVFYHLLFSADFERNLRLRTNTKIPKLVENTSNNM